jgi:hypothetical protein
VSCPKTIIPSAGLRKSLLHPSKNDALENKAGSIHTQMEFQFRNSSKGSGLDHTTMTFLLVYWTTFYVVTMFWSKLPYIRKDLFSETIQWCTTDLKAHHKLQQLMSFWISPNIPSKYQIAWTSKALYFIVLMHGTDVYLCSTRGSDNHISTAQLN